MIIFMTHGFSKNIILLCSTATLQAIHSIEKLSVFLRHLKVHLILSYTRKQIINSIDSSVNLIQCQDSSESNTDCFLILEVLQNWWNIDNNKIINIRVNIAFSLYYININELRMAISSYLSEYLSLIRPNKKLCS